MAITPEIVSPNVKLNVTNVKSIFNGGGKGSALVPNKGGSLVPTIGRSRGGALVPNNEGSGGGALNSEKVFQLNDHDPLEKRVAANERKITLLKRVVQSQDSFGGKEDSLRETNAILEDIGNALALDFSNRIIQKEDEISSLRESADSKRRGSAESGVEAVKKISSKVGKAFSSVTAPVKGMMDRILSFFGNLAAAFVVDKAMPWLAKNKDAVMGFFKFLGDHGAKIVAALGVIVGGVVIHKLYKSIRGVVKFVSGALKFIKYALKTAQSILKYGKVGKIATRAGLALFGKGGMKRIKGIGKFITGGAKNIGKGVMAGGKSALKGAKNVAKGAKALVKSGGKGLLKNLGKAGGKSFLKKIPIVGLGLGAAFAVSRLLSNPPDWTGAAMELGSGAASMIPGAGTGLSLAIDAGGMVRDAKRDGNKAEGDVGSVEGDYKKVIDTATNMDFSKNVKSTGNLQGVPKGGTTVMDVVKASDVAQAKQQTSLREGEQDSLPIVGAEDPSNFYISYTKEQLGIFA